MDWSWLPAGAAVVLFLGSATVYLRGSRDKGTIDTLTRNNAALDERVKILEASEVANKARIDALTHANKVLTNTVNSSELIIAFQSKVLDAIDNHHAAAMEGMEQIHSDLAGLPAKFAVVMKGKT